MYKLEFWREGVKKYECLEGERITIPLGTYTVKLVKDARVIREETINIDVDRIFFWGVELLPGPEEKLIESIITQPPEVITETITEEVGEVVA